MRLDDVRAQHQRIRTAGRKHVNEIVRLVSACGAAADDAARAAAVHACRDLFETWMEAGELRLRPQAAAEGATSSDAALAAYREWLRDKYGRFVRLLRDQLDESPVAELSLDTLLLLSAIEARHAKRPAGAVHLDALETAGGAFGELVDGLVRAPAPRPALLARLREAAVPCLDAAFHLLRHVHRIAKACARERGAHADRLVELLLLIAPPAADVAAPDAQFLALDASALAPSEWPPAAASLLKARAHRREFCRAWRATLVAPLGASARRTALARLPHAVLPHAPRPLRYCDILSDAVTAGGVEALLSLKGA